MRIKQLYDFGQSIWLDNISRAIIESGNIGNLIKLGVTGVTSNPTIFQKAISDSHNYDLRIRELQDKGLNTFEIYDALTIKDIQDAADLFLPVFNKTNHRDGLVSLEVNPLLSHNGSETIKEARRLHKKVDRKNEMFKIPATEEGLQAGSILLGEGISINFTLIFSLEQYIHTANSFLNGAKHPEDVCSVASVFVSRIDSRVDELIDKKGISPQLKGKASAANSSLIFAKYCEVFSAREFKQRLLWASTSTKNPSYSDIKYVTELMAKDTINTMPEKTIDAFLDHGIVKDALGKDTKDAQSIFSSLKSFGIDVHAVCRDLLKDGLIAFEKSFNSLLKTIALKGEAIKI